MNLKKISIAAVSALMLAGVGSLSGINTSHAHADTLPQAVRYLTGHNNHCYYSKSLKKYHYSGLHLVKGLLPRAFRHRGTYVVIMSPSRKYDKEYNIKPIKRIHGKPYYIDVTDAGSVSVHDAYIYIPKNDVSKSYKKRNKKLFRYINKQEKRINRKENAHRHNQKYITKLQNKKGKDWDMIYYNVLRK